MKVTCRFQSPISQKTRDEQAKDSDQWWIDVEPLSAMAQHRVLHLLGHVTDQECFFLIHRQTVQVPGKQTHESICLVSTEAFKDKRTRQKQGAPGEILVPEMVQSRRQLSFLLPEQMR